MRKHFEPCRSHTALAIRPGKRAKDSSHINRLAILERGRQGPRFLAGQHDRHRQFPRPLAAINHQVRDRGAGRRHPQGRRL
jgi:hypothetical protein